MPTITAQSIIDKAKIILHDTTNIRWTEDELLGWLNDAQREVVMRKPDAYAETQSIQLVNGTRQSLPPTGVQLIDVVRNMGADGLTPGAAISYLDRRIIDNSIRDWHSSTASSVIKHFCFDERDPKSFFVFPPSDGTSYVEIIFSASPADVLISDIITLDDIYANALLDYILYRAYLKDADYTINNQRAATSYQVFMGSLGLKEQTETMYDPNKNPNNTSENKTYG